MCLFTDGVKVTLSESLDVWKVFELDQCDPDTLLAPYMRNKVYVEGHTYLEPRLGDDIEMTGCATSWYVIEKGFHAFMMEGLALRCKEALYSYNDGNRIYTVRRCCIPKGSKVFYGSDGDIAASALTIPEETRHVLDN